MSDELERLKADLEVLQRHQGYSIMENAIADLADKIARLEAEADPWREAKVAVERFLKSPNHRSEVVVGEYIDHLTAKVEAQKKQIDYLHAEYENRGLHISELVADNDRLEKRVAELEAENAPIDPDGYQLGDFRVMKTAQEIARYAIDRNIDHPVTVKTARRAIWAIKEFVEQARHWHGLSKLQPYRWTSLGRDDKRFIDQDFDTTESPCDYDPDDHKPLGDMQPPFEGPIVGIEPVLDPARVLATAAIIYGRKGLPLSEGMCRKDSKGANPYRLKGASDE